MPTRPALAAAAAAVMSFALTASAPARARDALPTVDSVDFVRYAGTWYEIARLPYAPQAACAGDVTTTFTLRGMRTYDLMTRCRQVDGSEASDAGIARIRDTTTNAKMEWRFLPLALAWWPFAWTDYWIIDLASDYSYAMAATPTREGLWILARKPELDAEVHARLVAKARALGFDTTKLIRTRHSGS